MKKAIFTIFVILLSYGSTCTAYEVTLKYACHTAENDMFAQLVTQPLFADITKATQGYVNVEGHYGESLVKHNEMWEKLADGSVDIGLVISSVFYEKTPLSNVMDLPTLPHNVVADGHAGAMWHIYEKHPEMQAEYLSKGIRPLLFFSPGPEFLFTSKPVAKLEDLKGIRLVSESPITIKQFEFFDTANIYKGQLYDIFALRSEEACGFIAPADHFVLWNMEHITPYATIAPLGSTYITIAMSEKQWQKLPAEVREQIMDACGEAASRRYSAAYFNHFRKIMRANSELTIVTLTPEERQRWVYLNQPLVDEWLAVCTTQDLGEVAQKIYADLQNVKVTEP